MDENGGKKDTPLVRMKDIGKRFGSFWALTGAGLDIYPGETHILAGENGAGKSTLIKILAGVYREFEGTIEIGGKAVRPRSPLEAEELGVSVIHQELSLVPSMSVADNVFLGRSLTRRGGFVDTRAQAAVARQYLEQLGVKVDVRSPIEQLPIATQQLIEIAKALGRNAKVIVMDEPTSALSSPEVDRLFQMIDGLKARNCGIVYITHKMEEIERIADRITVLRDGRLVGSAIAPELPIPKLIQWMVGREIDQQFPRHTPTMGKERLRIEDFSVFPRGFHGKPDVEKVSLHVRAGEILGIGGLQGSGATELLTGLFGGYGSLWKGKVFFNGQAVRTRSPRQAIDRGIALLTNDRKATGLILPMSIVSNTTIADLPRLSPGGWLRMKRERGVTEKLSDSLNLHSASLDRSVSELSGGNQQKVVIGKWLQTDPSLLLLDEPTRGIDVGAKREIYRLMNEWTRQGIAIILITSEMPELLAMSDRILVMHRGKLTAEFPREEATPDAVLEAAMGRRMEKKAS